MKANHISDFAEAVLQVKPTAIIGVSTVGGAFNQQVIENMSLVNERPIIFPYSNPTSHSECTAEQAYTWSKGKAIFASGSPFAPVTVRRKNIYSRTGKQCIYFPGNGFGHICNRGKKSNR